MTRSPETSNLGKLRSYILLFLTIALVALLALLRGSFNPGASLDLLARRSLDPEMAVANGRPSVFEFYANWCEACKAMTPAMLSIEEDYKDSLNLVLLNVENPIWQDLIDKYEVTGIPQINLFDAQGDLQGKSIGLRTEDELKDMVDALIKSKPLPTYFGSDLLYESDSYSTIYPKIPTNLRDDSPRAHG